MTLYDKRKQKPFYLTSEGRPVEMTGWNLLKAFGWVVLWGVVGCGFVWLWLAR